MVSHGITRGLLALVMATSAGFAKSGGDAEARAAVQTFFSLLKAEKYPALYDYLPSEMQKQMTRDKLENSLKRLHKFIAMDKMEIGKVQKKGDFAVVDTTIFGRLLNPRETGETGKAQEGKIVVQQYLFKEKGHWKVATSDNNARTLFLRKHPEFKQGFQLSPPHLFIKDNGQWIGIN